MQYQKEEVRSRILDTATDEFYAVGYERASMLQISTKAKVPIGNLYRYFPSKATLFRETVAEAFEAVTVSVRRAYEDGFRFARDDKKAIIAIAEEIATRLSDTVKRYGKQIYILSKKSAGSEYQNFNENVAELVKEICKEGIYGGNVKEEDELMCSIISDNIASGIVRIFLECPTCEHIPQLKKLLVFYFDCVKERLL